MVAVAVFSFGSLAMAAAPAVGVGPAVTTKNVNVRILPQAGAARINHVLKGETVNVLKVLGGWCQIEDKRYRHAYVDCSFLKSGGTSFADYNGMAVSQNAQGNWVLGSANAKVTLEEFGDLQCPACAFFGEGKFPKLYSDYIATGKVKLVFYHFPLSYHFYSKDSAEVALCAGDQGKYWPMINSLLNHQEEWSYSDNASELFYGYAVDLGLKTSDFNACVRNKSHDAQISRDLKAGDSKGVGAVPTFYMNGKVYEGFLSYDDFTAALDKADAGK